MASFKYSGVDKSKGKVSGTIDANSRAQAVRKLQSAGIQPIEVGEASAVKTSKAKAKGGSKVRGRALFSKKTSTAEDFLVKLLQLHKSGMPVGDAIRTLKDRLVDPELKELSARIWKDLSEGSTLAGALKRFPKVFDDSLIYAIEAGEASGNLAPILENIVENLHAQAELKKRIYAGLAYPIFISCVALCVVALFLFYLLPRIQGMMTSMGSEMTLSARLLIGSADALIRYGPFVLAGIVLFGIFVKYMRRTAKGRRTTDGWLLRVPYISSIVQYAIISQTSNLMATLMESGVNTTDSMRLTEKIIGNMILAEQFRASQKLINDGAAISLAFKQNTFLPDLALDILSIGENTGNIAKSFRDIFTHFNEALEEKLKTLTTFISSVALFFAFMLVSVLAMSIVTSVMQFSNSLVK